MLKTNLRIVNKSNNPLPEYKSKGSSGMDLQAFITQDHISKWNGQYICGYYDSNGDKLDITREDGKWGVELRPLERILIPTGLFVGIENTDEDYYVTDSKHVELQIRPRSGLAIKYGITVLNTPGTVDSDYRDEVGVILINLSNKPYLIRSEDRIAQGVLTPVIDGILIKVDTVEELGEENRGGGFGHTGV